MRNLKSLIYLTLLVINLEMAMAAASLTVEKIVEGRDIKAGDDVKILLKFGNPFGKEIPVRIVDSNVLGSSGLEVQCLEYTLSPEKEATLAYEPLKPFKPGNFELKPAQVSYLNPETGKDEKITSNGPRVTVRDSGVQQAQSESITTVYRCGGFNMQSTSYSSSAGFSQQESNQESGNVQQRIENNQLNQNTNQLKQELQKDIEEQKKLQDEFQQNVAKNQQFRQQHKELLDKGYNLSNASFNPSRPDSGSFELNYNNKNGDTSSVKGEMENGTMKQLMSQSSDDRKEMLERLGKNERFLAFDKELKKKGFNQSQPLFSQISQNHTMISVPYIKDGLEKSIRAEFVNGTIKNVYSDLENEMKSFNWRVLLAFLIFAVLLAAGWLLYRRYKPKAGKDVHNPIAAKPGHKIDYLKESKRMLAEAEELFRNGREKDAYERVSQAVRFYFSHKLDLGRDLLSIELAGLLKDRRHEHSKVKKCLDMCALVEFAKYNGSKSDFDEIIGLAGDVIK